MKHRVEIEYCKNPTCRGHKGPNGTHAHVNLYDEGVKDPIKSPAFGSRKAGGAMTLLRDEATASEEEKLVSSLIGSAVATTDLPETYGDDDKFVESCKLALNATAVDVILIIGGGPGHNRVDRLIDHNQHTVLLTGCLNCGATMAFYHGDNPMGSATGVRTMDDAKHVLDLATERFKFSTDDAAALREKLPELFKA